MSPLKDPISAVPTSTSTDPASLYLAALSRGSRRTMEQALNRIAGFLQPGQGAREVRWELLRREHTLAVRSWLAETFAVSTANKMLCALKGTLRQAFELGLMDCEMHARAASIKPVRGSTTTILKDVSDTDLRALFAACDTSTISGARDAAILAVLCGAGLRRHEVVGLDLDDYDPHHGVLRVVGKGRKTRTVYVANEARVALETWVTMRGGSAGPLFVPIFGERKMHIRRLTDQTIYDVVARLSERSGVKQYGPHAFRAHYVGALLDCGADLSAIQQQVGHASPSVTVRYDRRGARAKLKAAQMLHVPFVQRVREGDRPSGHVAP